MSDIPIEVGDMVIVKPFDPERTYSKPMIVTSVYRIEDEVFQIVVEGKMGYNDRFVSLTISWCDIVRNITHEKRMENYKVVEGL